MNERINRRIEELKACGLDYENLETCKGVVGMLGLENSSLYEKACEELKK